MELPTNKYRPFYFDGINYIFELEPNGNSRMICEVRGEGDGRFEENAKLIVEALNNQLERHVRHIKEMVERSST